MSNLIKFSDLERQVGEKQAMRHLEAVEETERILRQLKLLRTDPAERFDNAIKAICA